jgi:hypothetical protein
MAVVTKCTPLPATGTMVVRRRASVESPSLRASTEQMNNTTTATRGNARNEIMEASFDTDPRWWTRSRDECVDGHSEIEPENCHRNERYHMNAL